MSYVAAKTVEIVRYCNMVTLDWVIPQIIGVGGSSWTADSAAWAIGEIHLALVNAGWHYSHHETVNGDSIHCYRRRLGDQQQPPPYHQPIARCNNKAPDPALCAPCRANLLEWLKNG